MDILTFIKEKGVTEAERLADASGTKLVYLKQIGTGFRRPSGQLALRIEQESGSLITRGELRPDLYPDNLS